MKIKYLILVFWYVWLHSIAFALSSKISNGSEYIFAAAGIYSVGYKDYHWINYRLCPDPYFNGVETQFNGRAVSVLVLKESLALEDDFFVSAIELPAPRQCMCISVDLKAQVFSR